MARFVDYNTDNIRVIRDENNIHFYSKADLTVVGIGNNVVLKSGGNVVENIDYRTITDPDLTILDQYIELFQTWIDQYVAPVPDPTIKLKAHTVGEPDVEIDIAIGTNLSITNNTLNATGGGGGGTDTGYLQSFLLMGG